MDLAPDGVIHLAALQMPTCKANPVLGARVNVIGTLHIFEAAKALKAKGATVPSIVYASSAAVFGPDAEYGEKAVGDLSMPDPQSFYGAFKVHDAWADSARAVMRASARACQASPPIAHLCELRAPPHRSNARVCA